MGSTVANVEGLREVFYCSQMSLSTVYVGAHSIQREDDDLFFFLWRAPCQRAVKDNEVSRARMS